MSEIKVISHTFFGGVYCKTMEIPEGYSVVSHKHSYDHISILSQGTVAVTVCEDTEIYTAPSVIKIQAGINHSISTIEGYGPAIWQCIHACEETDEDKVDEVLIKKQNMIKLPFSFDTQNALSELNDHPELWNEFNFRTATYATSPHREVSDIVLRYRPYGDFDVDHPEQFSNEHRSVWYDAIEKLPEIRTIIDSVMWKLPTHAELGGVLITKIPAGKQVYPHSDAGHWHSSYYNNKILVLLQSAPQQTFNFINEYHTGLSGEVFSFDNHPEHWVINNSDVDRISLILAVRDIPND